MIAYDGITKVKLWGNGEVKMANCFYVYKNRILMMPALLALLASALPFVLTFVALSSWLRLVFHVRCIRQISPNIFYHPGKLMNFFKRRPHKHFQVYEKITHTVVFFWFSSSIRRLRLADLIHSVVVTVKAKGK